MSEQEEDFSLQERMQIKIDEQEEIIKELKKTIFNFNELIRVLTSYENNSDTLIAVKILKFMQKNQDKFLDKKEKKEVSE